MKKQEHRNQRTGGEKIFEDSAFRMTQPITLQPLRIKQLGAYALKQGDLTRLLFTCEHLQLKYGKDVCIVLELGRK